MRYNRLGATPLIVSEIGFGAFAIGGDVSGNSYGPTDDGDSIRAIEVALDLGCTFFDTADVYGFGHSEAVLGRALRGSELGARAVVASKVGARFDGGQVRKDFSAAHIRSAAEESLRRLQRDVIDVYQLHDPPLCVLTAGEAFDCLEALVREGKIRSFGVSIHSFAEANAAIESARVPIVQAALSVLSLVEPDNRAELLLAAVAAANVGLIAREPLASGFLGGGHSLHTSYPKGDIRGSWSAARRQIYVALAKQFQKRLRSEVSSAQAAIRFVLDQPHVSTTIVGTKTAAQARMNFSAADLPAFECLVV